MKKHVISKLEIVSWGIFCIIQCVILSGCQPQSGSTEPYPKPVVNQTPIFQNKEIEPQEFFLDLEHIKKRGRLIALTGYSYSSYFIYKGTPMGYEYELLRMFANHLGVELEIVLTTNRDNIYKRLENGDIDIIADNLIRTGVPASIGFSEPYLTTKQLLIQKRNSKSQLRDLSQLDGKTIYVQKNSPYSLRLHNICKENGLKIQIIETNEEAEELIKMVSKGKIEYTIADEHTANYVSAWYYNIDSQMPVSLSQSIAWAMRHNSTDLTKEVNDWMANTKQKKQWENLYHKYFSETRLRGKMLNCARKSTCGKKISPYDQIIIRESERIGMDWRLITSIVYQESRFDSSAKSWAGAMGLMQLMPKTAEAFGVSNPENPLQSIQGGLRYLHWLEKYWKNTIEEESERIKFILASYNAGQEHVADARRLTEKYGGDPNLWQDVAGYLLLKANSQYNQDPVVRYGYCRGEEPVKYVKDILERYEHYKLLIQDDVYLSSLKSRNRKILSNEVVIN
jgi:membrane-bound lytic murein transglycosylase F